MSEGAATMLSVTDLVAFLGPVLAVAVSVLALAKGLDELTGGARLRNLEGVLREVQKPPAAGADPHPPHTKELGCWHASPSAAAPDT